MSTLCEELVPALEKQDRHAFALRNIHCYGKINNKQVIDMHITDKYDKKCTEYQGNKWAVVRDSIYTSNPFSSQQEIMPQA